MAVDNWSVPFPDTLRVVDDDDLGDEILDFLGRVGIHITSHAAPLDLVYLKLDIESDVVSRISLFDLFVVHFNRLNIALEVSGSKYDVSLLPEDTGLDPTNGNCSIAFDLVDIVDRDPQWLLGWPPRNFQQINGFDETRSVVPWHVFLLSDQVLPSPSRNRDKLYLRWVEPDLL